MLGVFQASPINAAADQPVADERSPGDASTQRQDLNDYPVQTPQEAELQDLQLVADAKG